MPPSGCAWGCARSRGSTRRRARRSSASALSVRTPAGAASRPAPAAAARGGRAPGPRRGLGEQVRERLIAIGAFDGTDAPRRELLWQLRSTLADANPAHPALGLTDDAQRERGTTR